jgi:hypothetical protein
MDDILDVEVVAEAEVEVENEIDIEIEVEQSGPAGKDGKSAYDIYVANGGELTEIEWLASLKGEPGQPGQDGKTPVLGEDYWTEVDKAEIKEYCDEYIAEQLGVIENGSY